MKKMLGEKKKSSVKNAPFEKILESDKTNFKCNLENDFKNLRKKNMHKIVVGQINMYSI